jgi:peptidoglycan hydrolase-like protein with peptidoglycan-binding domain
MNKRRKIQMSETEAAPLPREDPPAETVNPFDEKPGLREGVTSIAVHTLQIRLGVPADGVFGRMTANAVRAVQRDAKLEQTGVADEKTHGVLGLPWPPLTEMNHV